MRAWRFAAFAFAVALAMSAAVAQDEPPAPAPQPAPKPIDTAKQYQSRYEGFSDKWSGARMELAVWCAECGLLDEAQAEMGAAGDCRPAADRLREAWSVVSSRVVPRAADVSVSIDGGTRVRGAALMGPMMLDVAGRILLVRPETIRMVTRIGEKAAGTYRVTLADGRNIEGLPLDWRVPVTGDIGSFDVSPEILAVLSVDSMGAPATDTMPLSDPSGAGRLARQYRCFEMLGARQDLYAVYGASVLLGRAGGEWAEMAARAREYASRYIHSTRFRYPVLRRTKSAPWQKFTLIDGSAVTGQVLGRSPALVIVDEMTAQGPVRRSLAAEQVAASATVDVSPEVANRAAWFRVCNDFAKSVRISDHVGVLSAWGKLSHEFGGDPWPVDLETALKRQEQHCALEIALERAVAWTSEACPLCAGKKLTPCLNCGGRGKIKVEETCPRCNGKGPHNCDHCGGTGWLTCGHCHGAGTMGFVSLGLVREPITCGTCCGKGKLPCPRCTHGKVLCPLCGRKGTILVDKMCGSCQGTGGHTCARCEGSGRWAPAKPGQLALATMPEGVLNPLRVEYASRRKMTDDAEIDELLDFADWCGTNGMSAEAAALLQSASRVDPANHAVFTAAVDWILAGRWRNCNATFTLDDGNVLVGTCSMAPLLVRSGAGFEIIPFRDVTQFRVLEPAPQVPKVRITTVSGATIEGLLCAFPIELRCPIGNVSLRWSKVSSYKVTSEIPDPQPAKPPPPPEPSEGSPSGG